MSVQTRETGGSRRLMQSRELRLAYFMGAFVATLVCVAVGSAAWWKLRPAQIVPMFFPPSADENSGPAIELSQAVIDECKQIGAVVENANNPTGAKPHDTLLVRPDRKLGWVLRPNAQIRMHMLGSRAALNFDPPLLALPSNVETGPALANFIAEQSRLTVRYTIDEAGRRTTLPSVDAPRRVLLVGDSVCFGVMSNDENTISSKLQQRLGSSVQVVNGGVGGYQGPQCIAMARQILAEQPCDTVIYVACQNDFFSDKPLDQVEQSRSVISDFARLESEYHCRVVVLLTTYLEYLASDVLGKRGWPEGFVTATDELRKSLPTQTEELEIEFVDWSAAALDHSRARGSILDRFSYYVDHCHLSPLGTELAANELAKRLGPDRLAAEDKLNQP